jgi:hypothetical protein
MISVSGSTIAPTLDMQYVESDGEWNNYTPTLTWATATPGGTVTAYFKYRKKGKTVYIQGNYIATDGNGATALTISLPFAAKSYSGNAPALVNAAEKVNAAWTNPMGYVDDANSLIKFRSLSTATDAVTVEIDFTAAYEMA